MMQHCDLHGCEIDRRGCPWCLIESLEQQLQQAHRAGFEEGKKQAEQEIADWLRDDIYSIESKYLQNNKYKAILFFVSDELRQRNGLEG